MIGKLQIFELVIPGLQKPNVLKVKEQYYFIEIQYLGFRYHGFQKQVGVKTIQGMLDNTIKYVLGHDSFKTLAAGRTDAMVSVNQSAFELFLRNPIEEGTFFMQLQENLPPDIKVLSIREVDKDFNIIKNSKVKQYLYTFYFGSEKYPFASPYMAYIPFELDVESMKSAAQLFEGEHDFRRYCYKPTTQSKLNRRILKCELKSNDYLTASFFPPESYVVEIEGSGFLRYQIRIMMSAMFKVGRGVLNLDDIKSSLNSDEPTMLCEPSPASGLVLNKVKFF